MVSSHRVIIAALLAAFLAAASSAPGFVASANAPVKQRLLKRVESARRTQFGYNANGTASWYGAEFDGRLDARGERFDSTAMTAAHRTLPLNSMVEVTNLANGRSIQVRITDRGPYAHHRIIDLSRAAADALGYTDNGVARVNVRALTAQ